MDRFVRLTLIRGRTALKRVLALFARRNPSRGASLLVYHRVGADSLQEMNLSVKQFRKQMELLRDYDVVSLDEALNRLDRNDDSPSVVITFDDGFEEVYSQAFPILREFGYPFTVYLAAKYVSIEMAWDAATRKDGPGKGLSWEQLRAMSDSGLCTVGHHTYSHVPAEELSLEELDLCSDSIKQNLGSPPTHFAYPWGAPNSAFEAELGSRFRSAAVVDVNRVPVGYDRLRMGRIPVRLSDPLSFYEAKLRGHLGPERTYGRVVQLGKGMKQLIVKRVQGVMHG